jgi:putative cell wall-binding protein
VSKGNASLGKGDGSLERLFTLRRAAMAIALSAAAVTVVPGGLVDGPGPAGATAAPTGSISATSSLPVSSTGTGVTAGSITITLSAAGALTAGATLALNVTPSAGTGHIDWDNYDVSAQTVTVSTIGASGSVLDMVLGKKDANTSATIKVTQIKLSSVNAAGSVVVRPRLTGVTFTPSTASDGTVVETPPNAPTITLEARSRPELSTGDSAGIAGTWTLTMSGDIAAGEGWVAGSVLTVTVSPPSGTNCAAGGYLYFVGTPSASVSTASGSSATPSVSVSLTNSGACSASQPNELKLSFNNAIYFETANKTMVQIVISGVHYAVGTTATATGVGGVRVSASFSATRSTVTATSASNATIAAAKSQPGTSTSASTSASTSTSSSTSASTSAASTPVVLKADTPPVTVLQDAYDAPISSIRLIESSKTHVPVGYVCLTLSDAEFNTTAAASVVVSAGNGTASTTVTYQGESATAAPTAEFQVTKASTSAGKYTVSGLAVDADTRTGPVAVTATHGSGASCAVDSASIGSGTAFTVVATPVTRIYGTTPDATAAAELEHQFDAQDTACPGRAGARPVVLATDARFPDALTSAYLASSLGTGELLTPTDSLSAATLNAIRLEGITQVYIVGGPLAVSTAVSDQLESTLAYNCGGTTPLTSAGPVHIEVVRIAGATEYDTAQWVAEYPAPSNVGTLNVAGAYVGTDRTGGTGRYNDTAGNSSAAPGTSSTLPTAIVATGRTFQDAESASVLSYADRIPILLTMPTSLSPQVSSAITNLGIKQVIVMGGPLAITDAVVSSLESLGVSVLRIGGQDATDTAIQLADFEMGSKSGHLGAGWLGNGAVDVARGDYFTDGLAGAIVAAGGGRTHTHHPEPLVLCEGPTIVGPYLSAFLSEAGHTGIDGDAADRVTSLTILGGPEAVSPSVVTTMADDL